MFALISLDEIYSTYLSEPLILPSSKKKSKFIQWCVILVEVFE